MNKFCCNKMEIAIQKYEAIEFEEYMRGYYLPTSPGGVILGLDFCPFCGQNLGKCLNSEYYDILFKEYGLEFPETLDVDKVPEEFKTDEWWRKRGL